MELPECRSCTRYAWVPEAILWTVHLQKTNVADSSNASTRKVSLFPLLYLCSSLRSSDEYRPPTSASLHSTSPSRPGPGPQHVAPKTPLIPSPPSFPADYFLDNSSFIYRQGQIPLQVITLPNTLHDSIQEPRVIARLYFERNHPFFPFISNKNFYEHLPPTYAPPNPISTILIACMKLVSWSPREDPIMSPKSPTYLAIKQTLVDTDVSGVWSLQLLQATILISLYEMGHAIYPAAYTTIGTCARYALALGINESLTMNLNTPGAMLLEQEEKRRAWWAILILDR